jgi:hypothetical protein
MITFIIIILFFIQKKHKGYTLNMIAVKANHERELYKTKLEIQEQTFQEISREIHDNVGQSISLAKLGLSTLDLEGNHETKGGILEISEILEIALDDLRNMCRTLNSEIIKKGGLKKSIEAQVGYIKRGGKFNIQLHVDGEHVALDETKEIVLFRITQEAINNIIRHASATDISISLHYSKNKLILQIQDNGKGFNLKEQISGPNHVSGIYNMQNRANLIGAEILINSVIDSGTSIIVTTPY